MDQQGQKGHKGNLDHRDSVYLGWQGTRGGLDFQDWTENGEKKESAEMMDSQASRDGPE